VDLLDDTTRAAKRVAEIPGDGRVILGDEDALAVQRLPLVVGARVDADGAALARVEQLFAGAPQRLFPGRDALGAERDEPRQACRPFQAPGDQLRPRGR
jgi:hypothetical protein